MTINKRMAEVMKVFGLNKNQFAKRLGVHPTVIHNIIDEKGRGNKPSFDLISKLMSSFDNINGDWLLTGRGNMFLEEKESKIVAEPTVTYDKTALDMIRELSAENALQKKEIEELKGKKQET
jgi:plasmid maintenance system antidote protein VapI